MNRERLRPFLTGVAIVVAVGGLYLVDRGRMTCSRLRGPSVGQLAPDFALTDLEGQLVRLSALRGKVVVLDFWAKWCRPCIRKLPELERMQATLGTRGLTILAINVEGDGELVRRFLQQRPLKLKVLIDDRGVGERYAAYALPHVALVDRQGKLAYIGAGVGLDQRVEALLRQPEIRSR